jgi:hypothetical protein
MRNHQEHILLKCATDILYPMQKKCLILILLKCMELKRVLKAGGKKKHGSFP